MESCYTVAYLLKERTVKPAEKAVAMNSSANTPTAKQQISNN
jgi:hypothetical protein